MKKSKKELISLYKNEYKVTCLGHLTNYGTKEKCHLCPKTLSTSYFYFVCESNTNPQEKKFFYTGPQCGRDLAKACQLPQLPSPFTLFSPLRLPSANNPTHHPASLPPHPAPLLPVNRQLFSALLSFIEVRSCKPSEHIASLLTYIHSYGTEREVSTKQINLLNRFISEDMKGKTLTEALQDLADEKQKKLKRLDFSLLTYKLEEENLKSWF